MPPPAYLARILGFLHNHLIFCTIVLGTFFLFSAALLVMVNKDADGLMVEALDAMNHGRTDEALEILERIEEGYPEWKGREQIRYQRGQLLLSQRRDVSGAIREWESLLGRTPRSAWDQPARARLADVYLNQVGDWKKAMEMWRSLVKDYPRSPDADRYRFEIAACCVRTDQFDTASLELKSLMADVVDPHLRQKIAIQLAQVQIFQKYYAEAEETLSAVLRSPHCRECREAALSPMLDVLESREKYTEALALLEEIPASIMPAPDRKVRAANIRKKM